MASRRTSRSERRGVARRLLALPLGLLLGAIVVASAPFDVARQGRFPHTAAETLNPLGAAIVPDTPASQLAQAPAAGFPFWTAGSQAAKAGDTARARALVAEAVRRDPLLAEARGWLVGDAVTRGRFDEAVAQLDWIYTLKPVARPIIATTLARLTKLPRARGAVEAFAARKPLWQSTVIGELLKDGADPAITFRLLGGADPRGGSAAVGGSGMVATLAGRGDYQAAYLAWVAALPQSSLAAVGYVYDRDFRGLPGAPPFNWNLVDSEVASTDFMKPGVRIAYFGDGPGHLADQTLLLPAGRYRFVSLANSLGSRDANKASWTIACIKPTSAPLARLEVPVAASPVARDVIFDVAADCPAQQLSLDGTPAEFTASAEIHLQAVAITRVDGGA